MQSFLQSHRYPERVPYRRISSGLLVSAALALLLLAGLFLIEHSRASHSPALAYAPQPDIDQTHDITISDASAEEGTALEFIVEADPRPEPGEEITVAYSTTDFTAVAGAEYVGETGNVTLNSTNPTQTIRIDTKSNSQYAGTIDLQFYVDITNAQINNGDPGDSVNIVNNQGTGTILDNDPRPVISFASSPVIVDEGTGDDTVESIPLVLSNASRFDIEVNYQLRTCDPASFDGTCATEGADFIFNTGVRTFQAGSTNQSIPVTIINDDRPEVTESFFVLITPAGGTDATVANSGLGQVDIREVPEDKPVLTLSADRYEGLEDEGTIAVTATLNYSHTKDVTFIPITVEDTTGANPAEPGSDYNELEASDSPLVFQSSLGETVKSFNVGIVRDDLAEPNETFFLRLLDIQNATPGDITEATIVILDDDSLPILSVDSTELELDEGEEGSRQTYNFEVNLDPFSVLPVSVDYAIEPGNAILNVDYAPISPTTGTLFFPAGEREQLIPFEVIGNNDDDGPRSFTMTLSNANNAVIAEEESQSTAIIIDDDGPEIFLPKTQYLVDENIGNAQVPVELDAPSVEEVIVSLRTSDGTALGEIDYTPVRDNNNVIFPPGEIRQTVAVPILNDTIREPDETIDLELRSPVNGTLGMTSTGQILIIDDETAPIITLETSQYTLTESDAFQTISVTLRINAIPEDPDAEIAVSVNTRDDTTQAGRDYVPLNNERLSFGTFDFTTPFTPIVITRLITVEVLSDIRLESPEDFQVVLSNPIGARIGALNTTTITILDIPPPGIAYLPYVFGPLPTLEFTQPNYVVHETSGTSVISVTASSPVSQVPAIVEYALIEGSASAGSDFIEASGILTFGATLSQTQGISLEIIDDQTAESAEGFFIVLQNIQGSARLDPATSFLIVVILDNDSPTAHITAPPDINQRRLDMNPWKMSLPLALGTGLLWSGRALIYARRRQQSAPQPDHRAE